MGVEGADGASDSLLHRISTSVEYLFQGKISLERKKTPKQNKNKTIEPTFAVVSLAVQFFVLQLHFSLFVAFVRLFFFCARSFEERMFWQLLLLGIVLSFFVILTGLLLQVSSKVPPTRVAYLYGLPLNTWIGILMVIDFALIYCWYLITS
jgi:magnesium-transporting ATPase (P-type)